MTETAHNELLREAVARRIRALLAKTQENGATEAEAIAAAQKARELMDRYRLQQTDIEIAAEPICDETIARPLRVKTAFVDYCLSGISRYCGIRAWFSSTLTPEFKTTTQLRFLGLKADVEMARWLYSMIASAILSESNVYWYAAIKPNGLNAKTTRRAISAFGIGMATRINQRLIDMAKALEPDAKSANGTALVVVKGALVDAAFDKLGIHLQHRSGGGSVRDAGAYHAGKAAGDRVNLNRPVGENRRTLLG